MKSNYALTIALLLINFGAGAQVLTLDSCRTLALKNSEELKIQLNESRKYEINTHSLKTSRLPSVNGSILGFNVGDPINNFLPEYGVSAIASLSQSLYAGGYYKYVLEQN